VSRSQDAQNLAQYASDRFGSVDLLINAAGILTNGLSWLTPPHDWRRVLDVNLFSVVESVHHFVPRLIRQGHGTIVNIGSMTSVTSGNGWPVLRVEAWSAGSERVPGPGTEIAIGSKVQVCIACPGAVRTAIAQELAADASSGASDWTDALKEKIDHGMLPEEFVERVFDALNRDQFCILTHAEVGEAARQRLDQLPCGTLEL
jgi:NAD(P)-dependent dehydrogenase (short-subunit alcohol dehydrogenase family)